MSKVDDLLAWLLPQCCVLCAGPGGRRLICAPCAADLPRIPVSAGAGTVFAPLAYEYPVDRLVQGAKFHQRLPYARALGELLAEALAARPAGPGTWPDVLVPVPLHERRLAARGYNQALEIARPVAGRLGVRLAPRLARRIVATAEQSGLSRAARRRNLRGAFTLEPNEAGTHLNASFEVDASGVSALLYRLFLKRFVASDLRKFKALVDAS